VLTIKNQSHSFFKSPTEFLGRMNRKKNDDDSLQEESTKYLVLDFLVDGVVDEVLECVDLSVVVNVLGKDLSNTFNLVDDVTDDLWDLFADKFVSDDAVDNLVDDGLDKTFLDGNLLSGQNLDVGDDFSDWSLLVSVQDDVTDDFLQDVFDFNIAADLLSIESTTLNSVEEGVVVDLSNWVLLFTEDFVDDLTGGGGGWDNTSAGQVRTDGVNNGLVLADWAKSVNNWTTVDGVNWADGVEDGVNWTDGVNELLRSNLTVFLSNDLDLWVDVFVEENLVSEVLLEFWVGVELLEEWRKSSVTSS